MNQDLANEKINKWGMLLLLDVPSEMHFGIDNTSWKIGSKFKGVKLIPPGTHYVYYSLKDEKYQFKLSFFININEKNRIYIKRWNTEIEDFQELLPDEENRFRNSLNNYEFDRYLGAYPLEKLEEWQEVANHISLEVLNRLYSNTSKIFETKKEYPPDKQNQPKQTLPEMEEFLELGGNVNYTDIPKRKVNYGVSGEQLTKMNFDKSIILKETLSKEYENNYKFLFGEFQAAFINFLMGESLDSFNQWKDLFILITSCDELMSQNSEIFIDFIPVLYNQLKQLPMDFFYDTISSNNFMRTCLKNFLEIGLDETANKKLKGRCMKLQKMIKEYFKFDFFDHSLMGNNIEDEDQPTIVEDFNFIKI